MRKKLLLFSLIPLLNACFPEDELLPPEPVLEQVGRLDLMPGQGGDYQNILFYDLSENRISGAIRRDEFDLVLQMNGSEISGYLNSASLVSMASTGTWQLRKQFVADSFDFEFENAANFLSQGKLGRKIPKSPGLSEVLLLNLGRDLNGNRRGFKALQMERTQVELILRWQKLDGSDSDSLSIALATQEQNLYVALEQKSVKKPQPPHEEWDLYFGRYMERLFDGRDTLDYSVVGTLSNPTAVETANWIDSTLAFEELQLSDLQEQSFSRRQNHIGHDWKSFDIDANLFSVNSYRYLAIKRDNGEWYKFSFSSFYGQSGEKGVASFRYLVF